MWWFCTQNAHHAETAQTTQLISVLVCCCSGEKGALVARLAKLKDAGTDELREKAELQEALVRWD